MTKNDAKTKLTSYNFWIKLASAVLLLIRIIGDKIGYQIDSMLFMDIVTAVAGILVVTGIINAPTVLNNKTGEKEVNQELLLQTEETNATQSAGLDEETAQTGQDQTAQSGQDQTVQSGQDQKAQSGQDQTAQTWQDQTAQNGQDQTAQSGQDQIAGEIMASLDDEMASAECVEEKDSAVQNAKSEIAATETIIIGDSASNEKGTSQNNANLEEDNLDKNNTDDFAFSEDAKIEEEEEKLSNFPSQNDASGEASKEGNSLFAPSEQTQTQTATQCSVTSSADQALLSDETAKKPAEAPSEADILAAVIDKLNRLIDKLS